MNQVEAAVYQVVRRGPPSGTPAWGLYRRHELDQYGSADVYQAVESLVAQGWLYWRDPRVQRRVKAVLPEKQPELSPVPGDNDDRQDPLWR